jgi:PKD repeat protein
VIIASRPRPIDGARESAYSDGNRGLRTGGGAVRSSGMSGPATRRAIRWAVSLPAMLAGALALAAPASALPPAASFTVAPAAAAPGAMVTLASTSTDPDGDALTASWDFDNDGTTDATGTTVMHAFAASATVTLRVVDAAGESASISHAVTVIAPPAAPAPDPAPPATPPPPANAPPVAGFVVDPDVAIAGRPITFSSTAVDADGTIAAERWDLNGDGRFNDASGPTVTWAFAQPGAHIVRMRVQDNAGATSTYAMTVVVDALPSAAFTTAPAVVVAGDTVTFASTSRDSDGAIARQEWSLDGDGVFDDGTAATAQRRYSTPGSVLVRLRVTDDRGATATTSALVSVLADKPPLASFTVAPIAPVVGRPVEFTAHASDPDGSIAALAWDLDGDGGFDDASGATATRTYDRAQDVTVSLRATDDRGVTSVAFQTISIRGTVSQDAPTAPAPGSSVSNARPLSSVPSPGVPLLSPFPIVRIRGQIVGGLVRISLLSVRAPRGARVVTRCHGRGCPRVVTTARIRSAASPLRVRSLERRYRPGARLQVVVTMAGRIGKYVSFQMRRNAAPLRRDLCVGPRGTKPVRCPTR